MKINGTDTVFIFIATAMVMLMTPGLALFYGGMVKRKNLLNTTMHSYSAMVIVSLQWIAIGYTLVFGRDLFGFIGNLHWLGLRGVDFMPNADYAPNLPQQAFMMFQMMFAIITPALVSGAIAERMKTTAYFLYVLLWSTLVYDPVAHWVWGVGGWLRHLGALDFAGGNVVHITAGVAGITAAAVLGKRRGGDEHEPNNTAWTVTGAGFLWFGWFGFNAGSALALNEVAFTAFITTNTSAAAAAAAWIALEKHNSGSFTMLGMVSGAVSGLVAITPAAGYVSPASSIFIGAMAGILCYLFITFWKKRYSYDDALDAFGCHGIGGTWGALATGIFASTKVNPAGADGLLHGNPKLLLIQLVAVLATYLYTAVGTYLVLKLVGRFTELRVSRKDELDGLDKRLTGSGILMEESIA